MSRALTATVAAVVFAFASAARADEVSKEAPTAPAKDAQLKAYTISITGVG